MTQLAQRVFNDTETFSSLERDLHFHPAETASPKRLTREQVKEYNELGYVKNLRVFTDQQITEHREYFDRLLARHMSEGADSNSLRRMQRFCQPIWDIITDSTILDHVEDILGPNIVAWGQQYFCKLPGDGKPVSWHQDASYWPLTPAHTVTMWLAIDDSDRENGAMQVIPSTHTLGHLDFDLSGAEENSVLPQKIKGIESLGDPVYFEMKAGEMSLHADMLVHGSDPNRSNRRRCGLTIRYAAGEVVSLDPNWTQNSIHCRGTIPEGRWANVPRPERDYMDSQSYR